MRKHWNNVDKPCRRGRIEAAPLNSSDKKAGNKSKKILTDDGNPFTIVPVAKKQVLRKGGNCNDEVKEV